MLETLNRPNIKNIVLEQPVKSPNIDIFDLLTPKVFHDEFGVISRVKVAYNAVEKIAQLKFLFPTESQSQPFLAKLSEIKDYRAMYPQVTFNDDRELWEKICFGDSFTVEKQRLGKVIHSYKSRAYLYLDDQESRTLSHIRVVDPTFHIPPSLNEIAKNHFEEKFNMNKERGQMKLAATYASYMRFLNPSEKPYFSPAETKKLKDELTRMQRWSGFIKNYFFATVALADEVHLKDGLKITFYGLSHERPAMPYPVMDKLEGR